MVPGSCLRNTGVTSQLLCWQCCESVRATSLLLPVGSSSILNFNCLLYNELVLSRPDRKKYSLLNYKYFREDSRICYFRSKSLNMHSEWGNIKECNKNPRAVQNIRGHGDEPLNTFWTLELFFPISKKEFVLVLFQFPKIIVLNFLLRSKIHHSYFFLICKMYRLIPKWIVCSWSWHVTVLCLHTHIT